MRSPEVRLDRLEKKIPSPPVTMAPFGEVPHIIDFVIGAEYLNRPRLYPGQATVLKVMFLADDLFTEYDYQLLDKWGAGGPGGLEVNRQYGVASNLYQRIDINKAAGRQWFRYVPFAGGRRGSKGYIGSLAVSHIVWLYLSTGDPQEHFGIAAGKPLTIPVWAQSKDQSLGRFLAGSDSGHQRSTVFPAVHRRGSGRQTDTLVPETARPAFGFAWCPFD